jgi:hypothetical protein
VARQRLLMPVLFWLFAIIGALVAMYASGIVLLVLRIAAARVPERVLPAALLVGLSFWIALIATMLVRIRSRRESHHPDAMRMVRRVWPIWLWSGLVILIFGALSLLPQYSSLACDVVVTGSGIVLICGLALALVLVTNWRAIAIGPCLLVLPPLAIWTLAGFKNRGPSVTQVQADTSVLLIMPLLIFTPLVWWAWRQPLQPASSTLCRTCGYELLGLPPALPCPECGAQRPMPVPGQEPLPF